MKGTIPLFSPSFNPAVSIETRPESGELRLELNLGRRSRNHLPRGFGHVAGDSVDVSQRVQVLARDLTHEGRPHRRRDPSEEEPWHTENNPRS